MEDRILSFIDDNEKAKAILSFQKSMSFFGSFTAEQRQEAVDKHLGFEPMIATGYFMAVKLYIRPEQFHVMKDENGNPIMGEDGKAKAIILPDTVTKNDQFRKCAALVVAMGQEVYKGERYERSGAWCKLGDWIVIPRNEGSQFKYRGVPMQLLPDDRCMAVVEDPTYVELC